MLSVVNDNVVRDEVFLQNDWLTRAIAGAIMAKALQLAAHSQTNRVHRLQRGDEMGILLAEELSGKMILDVMEWSGGWMLASRPLSVMKKGIYENHQQTLVLAVALASQNELMKGLPPLNIKRDGVAEDFEFSVYFV